MQNQKIPQQDSKSINPAPIQQPLPEKESENPLIGGIKNAISHGEDIEKIKKSFISAGYSQQEVEEATQKLNPSKQTQNNQLLQSSPQTQQQNPPIPNPQNQTLLNKEIQTNIQQKKSVSKKYWVILGIISLLLIITAAILGVFWDKIVG